MSKLNLLILTLLSSITIFAQAPQKMSYQAVIRNNNDALITNTLVGMKISLIQGSAAGTIVYAETQLPLSNFNGLVSLEIGTGTILSGNFTTINWGNGPYFLKTETDPNGGANYSISGISQFLSVPYALYAENSGNPGPQGIQGLPGTNGTNGLAGAIGLTGPQGAQGIQGLPGTNGTNGLAGAIGLTGPQGQQGIQGLSGTNGTNGIAGAIGLTGATGLTGPQGIQGLPGMNGTNGVAGAIGLTGPQGAQGIQGLPGTNGTNGLAGAIGLTGPQGPQGIQGLSGTNGTNGIAGAIGLTGAQGLSGPQGVQGLPGANGATGPQGVQGIPGNLTTPTYSIGLWPELGGYVFRISNDGKHGLVSETINQGIGEATLAQDLISNPGNHSVNGAKFMDWRLPTKYEIYEMYMQRAAIGNFQNLWYWTSVALEGSSNYFWYQNFSDVIIAGPINQSYGQNNNCSIRSVRSF